MLVLPITTAPGCAEPPDDLVVLRRGLGEGIGAVAGDLAGHVLDVLDRDRYAEQQPLLAGALARVGLLRVDERPLGHHLAEGVQLRVEPPDPLEVQLDELARRHLARADELRQANDTREGKLVALHAARNLQRRRDLRPSPSMGRAAMVTGSPSGSSRASRSSSTGPRRRGRRWRPCRGAGACARTGAARRARRAPSASPEPPAAIEKRARPRPDRRAAPRPRALAARAQLRHARAAAGRAGGAAQLHRDEAAPEGERGGHRASRRRSPAGGGGSRTACSGVGGEAVVVKVRSAPLLAPPALEATTPVVVGGRGAQAVHGRRGGDRAVRSPRRCRSGAAVRGRGAVLEVVAGGRALRVHGAGQRRRLVRHRARRGRWRPSGRRRTRRRRCRCLPIVRGSPSRSNVPFCLVVARRRSSPTRPSGGSRPAAGLTKSGASPGCRRRRRRRPSPESDVVQRSS